MRDPRFPAPRMQCGCGPTRDLSPNLTDQSWQLWGPSSIPSPATSSTGFSRIGEVDFPAVVAVGRDLDPARFGPQPPHVHVEQYVDLGALVPRASVVLHHGGSGLFLQTVLGGAPQIVFPIGADQPFTAKRVQQLGVGRVLDPLTASPSTIRDAIAEIHADAATRSRVLDLRAETLTLPEPSAVIHHLDALVR